MCGQDEATPVVWLATRADKMGPDLACLGFSALISIRKKRLHRAETTLYRCTCNTCTGLVRLKAGASKRFYMRGVGENEELLRREGWLRKKTNPCTLEIFI